MEITINARLKEYFEERVLHKEKAGLIKSRQHALMSELLYCSAFDLVELIRKRDLLEWRPTSLLNLRRKRFEYSAEGDSADDLTAMRRDMTAMTPSLKAAIQNYIAIAFGDGARTSASRTVFSVLAYWSGEGLCEFAKNGWMPSLRFYTLCMADFGHLPQFRKWIFEQFNEPVVAEELKLAIAEELARKPSSYGQHGLPSLPWRSMRPRH